MSVGVRQHTQDVRGCPWLSVNTHRTSVAVRVCLCVSVCVRVCPSAHTGRRWLFVAVRQHTQDVRGCPCVSMCVCVCPSAHTGRPWLSISTHISTLVLGLSTLALPWIVRVILAHVGYLFSRHRTSVEVCHYTQDVRVCPSEHRGRPWLSVCVRMCPSAHRGRPWLSVSTHISTVLGLSTLTLPVDCSGDFGPRGLSVQYTQDVHGTSMAVRVCPCMSVRTHRTYVAVYQYTYQHAGPWTQHAALPVDCSGDFGSRGLSVQYTQDVSGCQSAHTGRPLLSVCVRQHTQDFRGCLSVHISARCTYRTSVGFRQHTKDVRGCLWLSISTHRTSVAIRVCPLAHTGRPWLSISTHISTLVLGLSTLAFPWTVRVILAHVGYLFSRHRTSVEVRQHTQDVRVCPSAHTGRSWLSVCVRVSVSTQRTSVAVRQYTYQHGPWTQHAEPSHGLFGTHRTSMAVRVCPCMSVSTHRTYVAVYQYTYQHAVHTGRPWVSVSTHRTSVAVRVCPCVSSSTHRTSVAVYQYTYQHAGPWTQHAALPVDCSGDFGPRGLSVQYTQDVCGFPPAHTGRPLLSVAVRGFPSTHTRRSWLSVCVRMCPCVVFITHRTSVAVHQYTYQHVGPWTQHAGPSCGLFG
ncbi:hypothetical protein YC2023_066084 [Brassica napus]